MDDELTLEQINDMSVTVEHQEEVISLQKDIINLLRRLDNKEEGLRFRGFSDEQAALQAAGSSRGGAIGQARI